MDAEHWKEIALQLGRERNYLLRVCLIAAAHIRADGKGDQRIANDLAAIGNRQAPTFQLKEIRDEGIERTDQ